MNDNEELKTARLLEQMEAADEEVSERAKRFSERFAGDSPGVNTTIHDILGSQMFNNWKAFEEFRNRAFFPRPTIKGSKVVDYCNHIDFGNPAGWWATASVPDKIFCGECYTEENQRLMESDELGRCCICSGEGSVSSVVPAYNIGILVVMCDNCNYEVTKELKR